MRLPGSIPCFELKFSIENGNNKIWYADTRFFSTHNGRIVMEKIRTVIVEDEFASLFLLKEELDVHRNIEVVAEYRDGKEGLEGINSRQPDLVFVDIEMPEMNGFQMLQHLTCNPVVIFCTGHKKYALEAWDYDAADFIIKPVESGRINRALEKAFDDIKNKRQEERLKNQKIFAGLIELSWVDSDGKKSRFFSADEITHIQGDRDYLQIHLIPDLAGDLNLLENMVIVKKTLKEAAKEWENFGFVRIHKSYLINFSKVLKWDKSARKINLQEVEESLPIGRSFVKRFQEQWNRSK